MIKKISILLLITNCFISWGQNAPINFEDSGEGQNWTWTVFENDTNPPLEIVDNPDPSGINTSSTVAKFTALQTGQPFAGVESMHGSDIGTFDLTSDNAFVTIMVYKTVISDIGIKYATPSGGAQMELKVANTLTNEWESITIDFTSYIGLGETTNLDQIIVFPDFASRSQDNSIYFDNISFSNESLGITTVQVPQISIYPNPARDILTFLSDTEVNEFRIYNSLGQLVLAIEHDSIRTSTIDISTLSSGNYFVEIETENYTQKTKFIKQ